MERVFVVLSLCMELLGFWHSESMLVSTRW